MQIVLHGGSSYFIEFCMIYMSNFVKIIRNLIIIETKEMNFSYIVKSETINVYITPLDNKSKEEFRDLVIIYQEILSSLFDFTFWNIVTFY